MEDIKRVISFESVEEFWGQVASLLYPTPKAHRPHRLYNHIVPPSQLPQKANYYLFKVCLSSYTSLFTQLTALQEGIIPAWEDEANKLGGKWSIQLPKDKNRSQIDKMWLYTVRSPFPNQSSFITLVIDACCHRRNLRSPPYEWGGL
jgi:translation initiation factor 4E